MPKANDLPWNAKSKDGAPKISLGVIFRFANTIGGYILLGIDENRKETDVAKRFTIIGVDNIPKIISDLWNTINSNKVNRNILLDSDVEITTIDGNLLYVSTCHKQIGE